MLDEPQNVLVRIGHLVAFQFKPSEPLMTVVLNEPGIDLNARNGKGNTAAIEVLKGRYRLEFAAIASMEDGMLNMTSNEGEWHCGSLDVSSPRTQRRVRLSGRFRPPVRNVGSFPGRSAHLKQDRYRSNPLLEASGESARK
jgi:hypothetical protein